MQDSSNDTSNADPVGDEVPEMELTDADILDAMRHIPGYLDITTEDFRTIYHLAHRHAVGRLLGNFKAGSLMRVGIEPLHADTPLDEAAKALVRSGYKALPVVDEKGCVIGVLTETDFLRRLKVDTFLELLLSMLDDAFELKHRCHETPVSSAMTAPAITVTRNAGFGEVIGAFHKHNGRSLPVVESDGRLLGLLLRKDFFTAYNLENIR
ncbi:MAG: CBS domain-containing protein [Gammaproteobacteria bacterium]|nr:CBS domain-containing protein [Gammaproteobacteria bacterium]MBU1979496.1 CBS domain-containing protein [Gammaproteobacteria bacterium]